MKVRNKTGAPITIIEFGEERVIPYDGVVYDVDCALYDEYKEMFEIIRKPMKTSRFRHKTADKPLRGKFLIRDNKKVTGKIKERTNRGTDKVQRSRYTFVDKNGKIYKDACPIWFTENMIGTRYQNLPKAVKAKQYKGWKVYR